VWGGRERGSHTLDPPNRRCSLLTTSSLSLSLSLCGLPSPPPPGVTPSLEHRGELVDAKSKLDDVAGRVSADLAAANRKNASLAKLIEDERSSSKTKLAELEARQKPMRDKLDELQKQNDAFMALYIRKNEQLKAERDKSIVQKIFGNSASESGD